MHQASKSGGRRGQFARGDGGNGYMRFPVNLSVFCICLGLSLPVALAPTSAAPKETETGAPATTSVLSDETREHLQQALKAARKGRWRQAHEQARKANRPSARKLLQWLHYTNKDSSFDFATLAKFIENNPNWPHQKTLRRKAEAALNNGFSPTLITTWFEKYPPISTEGRLQLAETLLEQGQTGEAGRWLRHLWINGDLDRKQSRALYRRFKRYFEMQDHKARLDRLLWDGERSAARRMLSLVPRSQRLLAEARLALMGTAANVDAQVSRVPKSLRNDPGLIYERVRWRRKRDLDDGAQRLLAAFPGDLGPRPRKWWVERRIVARRLLKAGQASKAYELASGHGQRPGSVSYADAEWLAGWIAFRFLDDNDAAATHFRQLYEAVKSPVSRARGAYWRGRVSAAQGHASHAAGWYRIAALFPTAYYGQLAAEALAPKAVLRIKPTPAPLSGQRTGFKRRELAQIAESLGELEQWKLFRTFILNLSRQAKTPVEQVMIAGLAMRFRRYELAVRVGKTALRSGQYIVDYGYPIFRLPAVDAENALVFAIMRQESEFSTTAISPAGAKGLMQLMPGTARQMAKSLGLRYNRRQLLNDPNYNVRLGSAYISSMMGKFDGSFPLAIAAYNGGPARVGEWLKTYGDPRNGDIDAIDWVELIPYNETRNYVQRVLEGLQIYRRRLSDRPVASRLTMDLNGRKVAN